MAKKKSRQTYLKRQRELQRMEKAELKRQRRLGRKRGEFPIESSPYGDVENRGLESGDPRAVVPEGESGVSAEPRASRESVEPGAPTQSIDIDAFKKSLDLSALRRSVAPVAPKKRIEPVAPRKSAESSESEPPPPDVKPS